MTRPHSLERRLVWRLVGLQLAIQLAIVGVLSVAGVLIDFESPESTVEVLRGAVVRGPGEALALRETPEMAALRAEVPGLWFTLRDRQGHSLTHGAVPAEFAHFGAALDRIDQARLGWLTGDPRPGARMRWVTTAAGEVQVLTGVPSRAPLRLVLQSVLMVILQIVLPITAVTVLASLLATRIVVRRTLAGLAGAAAQAARIDSDQRGMRLPVENVPDEVETLVRAVNDALGRLDEGYERHERFLADAAHELRTPIAILSTRLETLPAGAQRTRLLEDAARLAVLAEQLLDLQRMRRPSHRLVPVDLAATAQRVVADLAPLAIAAGYQIGFDAEDAPAVVLGDASALERALTNLVQNAIEHGDRRGTIAVAVRATPAECVAEICDEGPGVPEDEQARIFEPFHRLHPQGRGAGLGLGLVRDVMRLHGGRVEVRNRADGGSCFSLILPSADS